MFLSFYSLREGLLLMSIMSSERLDGQKVGAVWKDYWMGIKAPDVGRE